MNPDKIKIATEREFEYEKISRTIDKMDDIEDVLINQIDAQVYSEPKKECME